MKPEPQSDKEWTASEGTVWFGPDPTEEMQDNPETRVEGYAIGLHSYAQAIVDRHNQSVSSLRVRLEYWKHLHRPRAPLAPAVGDAGEPEEL